ncbi:RNA 2',3'-cyclic phosphodiesterase [soil metagenome]
MGEAGKRLFVGVRVSVQTANALAQCAEQLARRAKDANIDVKWVPPINYHLTLKFLGWVQPELVHALEDRIRAALVGLQPFKFRTTRLGGFPSLEATEVVWAGIEDRGETGELARRIETASASLGVAPESRSFKAHVTLGRVRETRPLKDVVLPMSEQMFSDTRVDGVILFESEMKSGISTYREISKITFKSVEPAPVLGEKRQTEAVDMADETDDGWPRERAK